MKKILSVLFFCCLLFSATAQRRPENWPKMERLTLDEIRTASNNILVAFFLGPELDGVSTDVSDWRLNGKSVKTIDKWITPTWRDSFGYEHHMYLTMDENLIHWKEYTLSTPHGDTTFLFNSREIFSESITFPSVIYTILAGGKTWDRETMPFGTFKNK